MEKKINIAELLKDCPKGMELDCLMYDNVTFVSVVSSIHTDYPIRIKTASGFRTALTEYGQNVKNEDAKCVIFPKGKTTWEGFVPPCKFKDGDVVISNHGDIHIKRDNLSSYCCLRRGHFDETITTLVKFDRLATEEEKQKLFDAIKENGYKWNAETKTLEKLPKFKAGDYVIKKNGVSAPVLITNVGNDFYYSNTEKSVGFFSIQEQDDWVLFKLKFKVGDKIKPNNGRFIYTITDLLKDRYRATVDSNDLYEIKFERQDNWELVPNKFDITTLKPFESKVLVRDADYEWKGAFFGRYDDSVFSTIGGLKWGQCIPYEGNEHLLGTTNDCEDYYKTWD